MTFERNWLLAQLPRDELDALAPRLRLVDLPIHTILETPREPIAAGYFPIDGIASVVGSGGGEAEIEVAIIGWEGMTGIPYALGNDAWSHRVFMQASGAAYGISGDDLRQAQREMPALRELCGRFALAFLQQASATALSHGWAKLEQRLARWILMAQDRLRRPDIPVTHEFLSYMLAVRRAGVTDSIHILEGQRLIRATKGRIEVRSREGLMEKAREIYGFSEAEYARLLGEYRSKQETALGKDAQRAER